MLRLLGSEARVAREFCSFDLNAGEASVLCVLISHQYQRATFTPHHCASFVRDLQPRTASPSSYDPQDGLIHMLSFLESMRRWRKDGSVRRRRGRASPHR